MSGTTRREPRTGRGEKTRDVLLDAAREVFWEKGYLDARVADIVEHAGVSHGSFYTWFDSKEAVLRALASDLHVDTVDTVEGSRSAPGGVAAAERGAVDEDLRGIEVANRRYLELFVANRKEMRLIEEVAMHNPEMRSARLATRRSITTRAEQSLRRMQAAGRCDPGLDPVLATHALVSMVSNFAYHMVSTETPFDVDRAVATLTTLWARGIGLDVPWSTD